MSLGLGRVALVLNEPEMALAALQEAEQLRKDPIVYKLLSQAYLETDLFMIPFVLPKSFLIHLLKILVELDCSAIH